MSISPSRGHSRWVRICHWIAAASFMALALSGFLILMVHPRLYLGHVGNDLTPALLTLPISNNYRPDELHSRMVFTQVPGAPVSAERNFHIFNKNGWARSLHFLAAWMLVGTGAVYSLLGVFSGHLKRDLLPRGHELAPHSLLQDLRNHFPPRIGAGLPYADGSVRRSRPHSQWLVLVRGDLRDQRSFEVTRRVITDRSLPGKVATNRARSDA